MNEGVNAARMSTRNKPPPAEFRFAPGVSGNPGGRPALPADLVEARKINQIEFERTVNKFLYMPSDEVFKVIDSPKSSVLDRLLGTILYKGAIRGDVKRAEWVMNRMLGKVKENFFIESNSKSVNVLINAKAEAQALSLDNPHLTLDQLEAFEKKVGQIKAALGADALQLPPVATTDTIEVEATEQLLLDPHEKKEF